MGLFDKKYCDVCGEKIGLLGNRKLEDANLCKNCASKLSPWFNERRHSTLEEIKDQLAYREDNKAAVAAFNTTRSFGNCPKKLLVDEGAGKFMITSASPRNLLEENPDVLDLSQVTDVNVDIDENRQEQFQKDAEGKSVSYDPKRYEYSYDFRVKVRVNHPYFDEMDFRLNNSYIETGSHRVGETPQPAAKPTGNSVLDAVGGFLGTIAAAAEGGGAWNTEYQEYVKLGNEIKDVLLGRTVEKTEEAAPKIKVTCPVCKAVVIPDKNGCCEYCGSPLPVNNESL